MQTNAPESPPGFSTAAGPEEALALFDRLPAVEPTELLGRWLGGSFSTGHPLNGVLERRGVASAAMLYNILPIVDVFRRLDAHTLLGVMDARGISQPFLFTRRHEGSDVASRASSLPKI